MADTYIANSVWGENVLDTISNISRQLCDAGCEQIKGREEYTLFRQIKKSNCMTQLSKSGHPATPAIPDKHWASGGGVISDTPVGVPRITPVQSRVSQCRILVARRQDCGLLPVASGMDLSAFQDSCRFATRLSVPTTGSSVSDKISSFRSIQSDKMCIVVGMDTEFQTYKAINGLSMPRDLLSIQMSILTRDCLLRYFALIDPFHSSVDINGEGGEIPLTYILSDILEDINKVITPLPRIRRGKIITRKVVSKDGKKFDVIDVKRMKDYLVPLTLVCHAGKADLSVFRRSKFDKDIDRSLSEIQGGWCSTERIILKVSADRNHNYYRLINLCIRDTLCLTPADNKSLKALGKVVGVPKIMLPEGAIENMTGFLIKKPLEFYEYAMNDSDIVVTFCADLFGANHSIPITMSSAAAKSMKASIKEYMMCSTEAEYNSDYRGLIMLDEGIVKSDEQNLKYLKATRLVPKDFDSFIFNKLAEESYVGGFNASFYLGWIKKATTDFDLQNAYPTAMTVIPDVDWSMPLRDLPRNYDLTIQDIPNPLIPMMAYIDFEFPDDIYAPNIPVNGTGLRVYPRTGNRVYACGVDIYLALRLGAKITCIRGYIAQIRLTEDGNPSQCLAYAVKNLVQDRVLAKKLYKGLPLVEKTLKTMVNSCYGKTAQNVRPKTRYSARKLSRVDAEPSSVTSPYHACYTTALVRSMLIGCINQLHNLGYTVYSCTTDGFITDAPYEVLSSIDAYGFTDIFQKGRYILSGTTGDCEENHIWEPKHYNDVFLNITTRGNVAINDEGVLAHNSYTTGEEKDSMADREALIIAVLTRNGKLRCSNKIWSEFSEIVERKHDFSITEVMRELSMDFDYKRVPVKETCHDTPVHHVTSGGVVIDEIIAEFDTRPPESIEEFLNYRTAKKHEECVKVTEDILRMDAKASSEGSAYIGKYLDLAILRSILRGYACKIYDIPSLNGLKGQAFCDEVNSWEACKKKITKNDWKNWKKSRKLLPFKTVEPTLKAIGGFVRAEAFPPENLDQSP